MAKALRRRDIETVVALPLGDGGFRELLVAAEVPFYELGNLKRIRATVNPIPQLSWLAHLWGSITALTKIIRDEDIAIVHQNDVTQIQGAIAGRLTKRKVVWHINGITYPFVYKRFKPLVSLLSNAIVASSHEIGREYFGTKKGGSTRPFDVLYPPIDLYDECSVDRDGLFRAELGIPDSCPVVATIGNLNPPKGHMYFIRAAALIKRQVPEARFVMIGRVLDNRGKYTSQLRMEIERLGLSDAVTITGFRDDIADVLRSVDVLVSASLSESFGMAVAEGLAAEKPVVATAVGGVKEIIDQNETGILVQPRDSTSIANAVLLLLNNPELAVSLAARGKEKVRNLFSADRCAAEHEKIYRRVVAGS